MHKAFQTSSNSPFFPNYFAIIEIALWHMVNLHTILKSKSQPAHFSDKLEHLHSACSPGHYGDQCAETCSIHCTEPGCNNVNGTCKATCKPGYDYIVDSLCNTRRYFRRQAIVFCYFKRPLIIILFWLFCYN